MTAELTAAMTARQSAVPADTLIELGAVGGAFGVRGWIRILPHSPSGEVLRATRRWWLTGPGPGPARELEVLAVKRHSAGLVARWNGLEDPESADGLKGARVGVARGDFPPLAPGEYYWVDLVGLRVINRSERELGRVRALRHSAAHDLLEIEASPEGADGPRAPDILVPVVAQFVDAVDREQGTIRVNWETEWLK